jgi:hypothetical protein
MRHEPPHHLTSGRTVRSGPQSRMLAGAGLGGMGPFLAGRRLAATVPIGHHPPRIERISARPIRRWLHASAAARSGGLRDLQLDAFGDHALRHKPPEPHRELSRQRHGGDALDPVASIADALAIAGRQRAAGLIAEPESGQLHHGPAQTCVAGLRDPLLGVESTALPRRRGQTCVGGDLTTVAEATVECLQPRHRRGLGTNPFEPQQTGARAVPGGQRRAAVLGPSELGSAASG